MARIAFPLAFKIVDNTGFSNTGQAIDERFVFGDTSVRDAYVDNFFYEGLLSYTIGDEYHISGVTSNGGFYYRNSIYEWQGLNADTIDDKHAYGTMDSSSSAVADPTTSTNIVSHINYIYTRLGATSTGMTWLPPVAFYGELDTEYPSPSIGDSALVTSQNMIYTYNGSIWIMTGGYTPMLSGTVSGIVSSSWYTTLNDLVTTPSKYLNEYSFNTVQVNSGGVNGISATASAGQSSFTLRAGTNITLSSANNVITINGGAGGTAISANNTEIIYQNSDGTIMGSNLRWDNSRLTFSDKGDTTNAIVIGNYTPSYIVDASETRVSANNILIGNLAGHNLTAGSSGITHDNTGNVFIGTCAGSSLNFNTTDTFIVSTGSYTEVNDIITSYSEQRLLEGIFPASNSSTSYGSLKVRGITYFKENDVYINRLEKSAAGQWDMTLTSPLAGTVYLSDLITTATTGIIDSTNGLTDDGTTVSLGGSLTSDTTLDGLYSLTISTANVTLGSGNTGLVTLDTAETPATYNGDIVLTADWEIPNKKYVDDLFDSIPASHNAVSISSTANGLSIGSATQQLAIALATASTTGALSLTDWNTFNGKQAFITAGTTTQYYRGDKSWQTLDTDNVPQGSTNLYFSTTAVRATTLTGLNTALTGDILSTDSVLQAFGKIQYQLDNIVVSGGSAITLASPSNGLGLNSNILSVSLSGTGTTGTLSSADWNTFNAKEPAISTGTIYQYYRGDKTWQSLTTTNVVEGTNKYFTDVYFDDRLSYWGGIESGFAPLNSSLKIPTQYLPAYVSEIIEVANYAALPVTGVTDVIYLTLNDNAQYRWSGSTYVEISASTVDSVNGETGIVVLTTDNITEDTNLYFTESRVIATLLGNVTSDIGNVISTDSLQVAISKLQNRLQNGQISLAPDILNFSTNTYTPYTTEYASTLWIDSTDNDRLKYSGDFGATSIKSDTFSIGQYWRLMVDPALESRLLLQYDTTQDGNGWNNVSTFEGIV